MAVHTAIMELVNTNAVGDIVYKETSTIGQVMNTISGDRRIFQSETGSAPNAATRGDKSAPTIHEYLEAEATDGFAIAYIDQYYIITQEPLAVP